MAPFRRCAIALLALTLCAGATPAAPAQTTPLVARPAPPELLRNPTFRTEYQRIIVGARKAGLPES